MHTYNTRRQSGKSFQHLFQAIWRMYLLSLFKEGHFIHTTCFTKHPFQMLCAALCKYFLSLEKEDVLFIGTDNIISMYIYKFYWPFLYFPFGSVRATAAYFLPVIHTNHCCTLAGHTRSPCCEFLPCCNCSSFQEEY